MAALTDLPLFPLGLVLYPDERLPLHIFEPRYMEMIGVCLETDTPFGVVLFDEGKMADVGCTARVETVARRYEDGRMDLIVRGEQRFRILEMRNDRAYLTADIEPLRERPRAADADLLQRAIAQHMKLLELAGKTLRPNLYRDVPVISFVIAHNAGLTLQQKQTVLEMQDERERIAYLIEHLETLIPRVEQMEEARKKIQSNGHFRDF